MACQPIKVPDWNSVSERIFLHPHLKLRDGTKPIELSCLG